VASRSAVVGVAARAAAIVLAGVTLGFVANAARRDGLRFATYEAPVACSGGGAEPVAETSIAPHKAQHLCGRSDVMILDARSAARFAEGHVASAVHLPCSAAAAGAHSAMHKLERASTVVVYGDTDEDAAPVLASLRSRLPPGTQLLRLEGGFQAWEQASLSCASGPCEACKEASHP